MTRLTDDAIAAIRARVEAATPGPWRDLPGWDDATDTENNDRIVTSDYTDDNRDQRAVVVGELWYDGPHVLVAPVDATFIAAARTDVPALLADRAALVGALKKISAIRDSIIGMQGFNFSEHAYPLVAALNEAGYAGAGYEIARANLGTVINQRDAAIDERDALAAKLAEVERERDEARDRYQRLTGDWSRLNESYVRLHGGSVKAESERSNYLARLANRTEERDTALAEQRRLAARVAELEERLRAVGAIVEDEQRERHNAGEFVSSRLRAIADRCTDLPAPPQPPAVDREASLDELARLSQEFGGYEELREQGNAEVVSAMPGERPPVGSTPLAAPAAVTCLNCGPGANMTVRGDADLCLACGWAQPRGLLPALASAIRALPDEEPPSGYVERAEVLRCEVAVVEAVTSWRDGSSSLAAVDAALDALRAARKKAGGK